MIKLFHGKSTFLSKNSADEEALQIQSSRDKDGTPFEYKVYDASNTSIETIIAEIETPSLFSRHKILYIKRPTQNDSKEELFECLGGLFDRSDDETDIILWEDSKLRSNLTILKPFRENNAIEESPDFNKRSFRTWAADSLSENKLSVTHDGVFLLSERTNYDPERFTQEVSKIRLLGKNTITEEDIEELCPDTLENTIWELIDSINEGSIRIAGRKLDRLLRQGNDPFYVLLMIARNIRIMLLVKKMSERGASTGDIARKIKAPPFTISAIREKAEATSYERIALLYEKLSNIDYSGKTGQLDVALALNILLSVI